MLTNKKNGKILKFQFQKIRRKKLMYLIRPENIMKLAIQIMVIITYRNVLCQMNMKINVKNYITHVIKNLSIYHIPQHITQPGYVVKKI